MEARVRLCATPRLLRSLAVGRLFFLAMVLLSTVNSKGVSAVVRYRASLSVLLCKQRLMVSALLLRCSLSVVVCVRERDNAAAR